MIKWLGAGEMYIHDYYEDTIKPENEVYRVADIRRFPLNPIFIYVGNVWLIAMNFSNYG